MHRKQMFRIILVILAIMALTLILGSSAWAAEQYKTIHRFNKQTGVRGFAPAGALILDAAGNLYGTTYSGGASGVGTVFELTPNLDGSWTESVLHSFNGADGADPYSGLIFDAAGNLYGTTVGGGGYNAGTVFKLAPNLDGSWTESVLHSLNGTDGAHPYSGLIFDAAGNLYGTTWVGGAFGHGTVFELTANGDGSWTESVLHAFNGTDGAHPYSGLIFDAAGNLYGTTYYGGGVCGCGTVFKLTPNGDGSWTESVLHAFTIGSGDGNRPRAGLIFDAAGNLYGTTENGGGTLRGTVFKLTPNGDGSWTESVLHLFRSRRGKASHCRPDLRRSR